LCRRGVGVEKASCFSIGGEKKRGKGGRIASVRRTMIKKNLRRNVKGTYEPFAT